MGEDTDDFRELEDVEIQRFPVLLETWTIVVVVRRTSYF